MKFGELLSAVGIDPPKELVNEEVSCIVTDSRKAIRNCIFVCLRGALYDGHDHIGEAIAAGAKVIVAEKVRGVREGGAALTFVNNTRLCASLLYNEWYGRPAEAMNIIGVTGTNGKTSVACMLKAVFESVGYSCALIGTLGVYSGEQRLDSAQLSVANMTTPDPEKLYSYLARMREDKVSYVFMEVSSHSLEQCRVAPITFDSAVFTNLASEHLDFHGTLESYYKAKEKLFSQSRRAVVNIDDAAGRRIFRSLMESGREAISCSRIKGDFCAEFEKLEDHSPCGAVEYTAYSRRGATRVSLPNFWGSFQVMNSLEAIALADIYGISADQCAKALQKSAGVRGRMERLLLHPKQSIELFIDYAHTPDALERALGDLRVCRKDGSRIILLFGCGGDRDRSKRKAMGQIASRLADFVIVSSDNSRSEDPSGIIREILRGVDKEKPHAAVVDRRDAINKAIKEYSRPGDILLLAGKGHECYEIDSSGAHPFDEREIARKAFCELYGTAE